MITWATPIFIAAIYGLVRFFSRSSSDDKRQLKWSALEAVTVGTFIYFISQILGALVAYGFAVIIGQNPESAFDWLQDNNVGQFILILAIEALTTWLLISFLKRRQASLRSIGLSGKPAWRDLGYIVLGFVIYFILFVVVVSVLENLVPALNIDQEQEIGFKNPVTWQLPLVFASLVLMPAVVEELVVRGFVYSGLKQGIGKWAAALLASFLFAIAHLQAGNGKPLLWIAAVDTFVLSLVLIYIKEKTGRLWAPIGLHMVKNSIAFFALYVAMFYS
jgi:membrane protease YdiL (CAAX protease family)